MEDKRVLKKAKPVLASEAKEKLIEMAYWNDAYCELLNFNLLSLDKLHPDYEVQQPDFFFEKEKLKVLDNYPHEVFEVNNVQDAHNTTCLYAVELYGRYASRQKERAKPIFSYVDYQHAGIQFYAFLLSSNREGLHSVLLFDNYESVDENIFNLRFEWWHPASTNKEVDCSAIKELLKKSIRISDSTTITRATQIRPFEQDPIRSTYAAPLFGFTLRGTLNQNPQTHPFARNPGFFNQKAREYGALLNSGVHSVCEEMLPTLNPDFVERCANLLPWWEVIHRAEIQLPLLNSQDFNGLEEAVVHENFRCLFVSGEAPDVVKEIAQRYEKYLKREQNYEFNVYSADKGIKNDIFLVMTPDSLLCLGIFIFKKTDKSAFFERVKAQYDYFVGQEPPDDDVVLSEVEQKLSKNRDKLDSARAQGASRDVFSFVADPAVTKYNSKLQRYTNLKFFAHAKTCLPADTHNVAVLQVAWIHPFHRRQGILAKLWPTFSERYGAFDIDGPSDSMRRFIEKQNGATVEFTDNHVLFAP